MKDSALVCDVVYEINMDNSRLASKAFLNEKEIKVSDYTALSQSLIATGFPYTNYEKMKPYMAVFDYCVRHTHGLRP